MNSFFDTANNIYERSEDSRDEVSTIKKLYIAVEGSNSEKWYFDHLSSISYSLGFREHFNIICLDRNDSFAGYSHPKHLIERLISFKEDQIYSEKSDSSDEYMAVFDIDIFRRKFVSIQNHAIGEYTANPNLSQEYHKDLYTVGETSLEHQTGIPELLSLIQKAQEDNIHLGITNPAFELFLLLHQQDTYEKIIKPVEEQILGNVKVGKKRKFPDRYVSDVYDFNPKTNKAALQNLVIHLPDAILEEKKFKPVFRLSKLLKVLNKYNWICS